MKYSPDILKNLENFSTPSDYFLHDIFSDSLIKNILTIDYNSNTENYYETAYVKAIEKQNFGNMFGEIFSNSKSLGEDFKEIGDILNVISFCLDFEPCKRPSIQGLFKSSIFKQDNYQLISAKNFTEIMFFYKSPALNIKDLAFDPLRKMCIEVLRNNKNVLKFTSGLTKTIEVLISCITEKTSKKLENLKRSINFGKIEGELSEENITEINRNKLPNYSLVKFIFDNDVLDMLVFLALRHHKAIVDRSKEKKYRNNSFEDANEETWTVLTGLRELFKRLFFDLQSHDMVFQINFLINFTNIIFIKSFYIIFLLIL